MSINLYLGLQVKEMRIFVSAGMVNALYYHHGQSCGAYGKEDLTS